MHTGNKDLVLLDAEIKTLMALRELERSDEHHEVHQSILGIIDAYMDKIKAKQATKRPTLRLVKN
jgi:hypothetical protein